MDDNPETDADPAWTPLLVTPAIPGYQSGHATLAGVAGTVLSTVFGEWVTINLASDAPAMTGVVRSFPNFSAMMNEVVDARIVGGIHFRTADVDGEVMGIAVARYALDRALLPCK
jgi:hypothetical protein